MQRLFSTGKTPVFVDSYAPGVEKRRGEEVSILKVKMRVQPFDAKLASALDDGVGEDSNIKATVFNLSTGEPKKRFSRHDFALDLERQNLEIFATPDTEVSRIALNQCRVSGTYVRTQKDTNGLALVFVASLGPVGRDELELIHSLHRRQTFVTFHQGEPILDVEVDDDEDSENDEAEELGTERPAPMLDDPRDQPAEGQTAREVGSRRKLHSHQAGKKKAAKRKKAND